MTPRVVLVVGGSSDIGRAIAAAFRADGDQVAGCGLEPCDDDAFNLYLTGDCADPAVAASIVGQVVDEFGRLDVVVPAAAVMPVAPADRTTDTQWRTALGATLDSAFFVTRAALPRLRCIVAVSSVNATLAAPGLPAYAAAKAGLEGLVRQLALEYGPRGIRVNAVAPGLIGAADLPGAAEGYPLRRIGRPEEVAAAVVFLASAAAGFITGVTLPVDGGLSIASPAAFTRPDLRARWLTDHDEL